MGSLRVLSFFLFLNATQLPEPSTDFSMNYSRNGTLIKQNPDHELVNQVPGRKQGYRILVSLRHSFLAE